MKNKKLLFKHLFSLVGLLVFVLLAVGSIDDDTVESIDNDTGSTDADTESIDDDTGSKKVETGIEVIDRNNEIIPEIGTSYGYIWESMDTEAQIYGGLAFDDSIFRITAYSMNGKTNSEDFTKLIELYGKWSLIDSKNVQGVFEQTNINISWTFSDDYATLTNNKGSIFQRIKVTAEDDYTGGPGTVTDIEGNAYQTIDGTYTYSANRAEIEITISGDSWYREFIFVSGLGSDYDNQNAQFDNGIVNGNDLYDSSGIFKIGYVSGNSLTLSTGETLRKN